MPIETPVVGVNGIIVIPTPTDPVVVVDMKLELYAGLVAVVSPTILALVIPPSRTPSTTVLNELPIETPEVSPIATIVAPTLIIAVTTVVIMVEFTIGRAIVVNPMIGIFVPTPEILNEFPIETPVVLAIEIIVDPTLTVDEIVVCKKSALNAVLTVL